MSKILGIDYGKVRIGIAVSDESYTIAFGRKVIENNKNLYNELKKIISEENITLIILGYPLNLKGLKTQQTRETEKFETELVNVLAGNVKTAGIVVTRWDERFTSSLAADSMIESGMKKKKRQEKGNIDIISAALMLQSYLDSLVKQ